MMRFVVGASEAERFTRALIRNSAAGMKIVTKDDVLRVRELSVKDGTITVRVSTPVQGSVFLVDDENWSIWCGRMDGTTLIAKECEASDDSIRHYIRD